MGDLFDTALRAQRRDRAARRGVERFLFERVFADCLERLMLVDRRFDRALLLGCPDPEWPRRLAGFADHVDVRDPGPLFAAAGGGETIIEDAWLPRNAAHDLVLALGTLDTVNDLPLALRLLFQAMTRDALLIGAVSGGANLPRLRSAMRAADAEMGWASPHIHPRIEASALAPLLANAGFVMPVVDVDRINATYVSLAHLVGDLRGMAATNLLCGRPAVGLSRAAYQAAASEFERDGIGGRTAETFEILHFMAWKKALSDR